MHLHVHKTWIVNALNIKIFMYLFCSGQQIPSFDGSLPERPKIDIYTDSSHLGTSAFYNGKWFFYPWSEVMRENLAITWMETFPTVIAARLWGSFWTGHDVKFHVTETLNKHSWNMRSDSTPEMTKLMTHLKLMAAQHDFSPSFTTPFGSKTNIAYLISRNRIEDFQKQFPGADKSATEIPDDFMEELLRAVDSRPPVTLVIRNGVIPQVPEHLEGRRVAGYILDPDK